MASILGSAQTPASNRAFKQFAREMNVALTRPEAMRPLNWSKTTIAFELAGAAGAAWTDDDGALEERGTDFLMRQASCMGGGTTEMARNVISERVLGMPRERTLDRDVAFRDVARSASK